MADVARLAGVSHQTVSRVINGQDNLRPATREKVEDAIRQLGYRPNTAARALVTRKSATIGVIGSKSGYWGPSTVHRTIQAAGRDAGYFVSSVNLQSLTRDELVDAIDHLRNQGVEGIVLIHATDAAVEVARAQEQWGVPVIVVEGDPAKAHWTVGVDQVAGAEARHAPPRRARAHRHRPPRGTAGVDRGAGPPAGLAERDVRRRAAALAARRRRLVGRERLRAGPRDRRTRGRHGRLLRQRPDGAGPAPCAQRGRPRPCRPVRAA